MFDEKFGLNEWPTQWRVDPVTYANCCQAVFNHVKLTDNNEIIPVAIGKHGGLMFKGVELILGDESDGKVSEEV